METKKYDNLPHVRTNLKAASLSVAYDECNGTAEFQRGDDGIVSLIADLRGVFRLSTRPFNFDVNLTLVCDATNSPHPIVEYRVEANDLTGEFHLSGAGNQELNRVVIPPDSMPHKFARHEGGSYLDVESFLAAVLITLWA